MTETISDDRRLLLLAPLLALLPAALAGPAAAAGPDPAMTIATPPNAIRWEVPPGFPPNSVEMAPLWSKTAEPGLYYVLVRWHPGYMSAPHWYETDRLCVVVSGTWWVNSGESFDPEGCIPMPAGSFIRRVARTPHYDGVRSDGTEPAVIAICGIGPITLHRNDSDQPAWRKL